MKIVDFVSEAALARCEQILNARRDPEWFEDRETVLLILDQAFPELLQRMQTALVENAGRHRPHRATN